MDMVEKEINKAIETNSTIEIEYCKYNGEISVRIISDIEYSSEFGAGYISAYCHTRKEQRTFKMSRIRKINNQSYDQIHAFNPNKSVFALPASKPLARTSNVLGEEDKPSIQDAPISLEDKNEDLKKILAHYVPPVINQSQSVNNASLQPLKTNKLEGCYIATMAYGSYDHPQVLVLRQFRDHMLMKNWLGCKCVELYYMASPHLVKRLKGHSNMNRYIRNILDCVVGLIEGRC